MHHQTVRPTIKALVAVTYVAMIATNALANVLPINGQTTGDISDSYPNLFAPAGITFSIWSVIYLLLGAHVLYQLGLFRARTEDGEHNAGDASGGGRASGALLERIGVLFALSSLANTAWILTWHYEFILLSTVLLATMLVLLILITRASIGAGLTGRDWLLVRLPFSVYFGWVTVATIANITTWLVSIGWGGFGITESTWAVLIIAVGAIIGCAVTLRDKDIPYALVFIWAYLGIWIKHTSASGFDGKYPAVIITALAAIGAFVVAGAVVLLRSKARSKQQRRAR